MYLTTTSADTAPGELKYTTFNTSKGWIGILGSSKGLLGTTLPQCSAQAARQLLGDRVNYATHSPHWFEDLMERLRTYFNGHQVTFPDELNLSGATSFQRKVWEITKLIPYGKTRSYLWVAEQIKQPEASRERRCPFISNPPPKPPRLPLLAITR